MNLYFFQLSSIGAAIKQLDQNEASMQVHYDVNQASLDHLKSIVRREASKEASKEPLVENCKLTLPGIIKKAMIIGLIFCIIEFLFVVCEIGAAFYLTKHE